ncbi:MAG: response regulator [Deltaproteobacteria bacterium]|nr:response regulator [Deltaproteobacteria bacterium]
MSKQKQTVLVVDDSAIWRRGIGDELSKGGFNVVFAQDGQSALEAVKQATPDLITLDVNMPGLDGFETCILLRTRLAPPGEVLTRQASIPIIMVTADDTLKGRERGFEVGATEFIVKPFPAGELLNRVNRLLRPTRLLEGETVLIVDDSEIARTVLRGVLTNQGATVLEAEDGLGGLAMVNEYGPSLTLIIVDYLMPGINGLTFAEKIRENPGLKDIPLVMLSGVSERDVILRMFKAGITDYLVKPFLKEELLARLEIHLRASQMGKELRRKVDELETLHRIKDEFLAVTSHDVRTPLQSILGYCELLANPKTQENKKGEFLNYIRDSGKHLAHLLDELAGLSHSLDLNNAQNLSKVSLTDMASRSVEGMHQLAKLKHLRLELEFPEGGDALVKADPNILLRIFNNLISNSIKFTPSGGLVAVKVTPMGDGHICASVTDTGIGFPESLLNGLFDKKTRASRLGTQGERGTGLGLSIVKTLMEKLNGSIQLESREGHGTTVTLTFKSTP